MADIFAGEGAVVIDPHGDLATDILDAIPRSRINDVCYLDASEMEYPVAFNPAAEGGIQGDNPALIEVGATYNDLAATITGPQDDLDLGIQTFVNGVAMSPVQIDTSSAATDTIDYVAADQNGLTSTTTRTVLSKRMEGFVTAHRQGQESLAALYQATETNLALAKHAETGERKEVAAVH